MKDTAMLATNGVKKPGSRRGRPVGGPRDAGEGASVLARRQATLILEVLAGARTPADAAQALSVGLPRYYQLETRAVQGLLLACEPRPMGRAPTSASALAALRQECEQLRRECARQQALVRVTQRTIGLAAPAAKKSPQPGKRRRRPTVRALRAAAQLRPTETAEAAPVAPAG